MMKEKRFWQVNLKNRLYFSMSRFSASDRQRLDLLELGIHLVGGVMIVLRGDLVELSTLQRDRGRKASK